ncbi:hypothetical protein LOK49_LG05G03395 [Camellia lanceoleosa]|uniref:Uncharacterized protein n=1 Tax=Camellia lanceoleosa TaxID=1840588 RepID=A0ACC0HVE5_9ERIC|nr:hypothetical protein LOK49_LG05G03395 [Camellia lanceoleosa]
MKKILAEPDLLRLRIIAKSYTMPVNWALEHSICLTLYWNRKKKKTNLDPGCVPSQADLNLEENPNPPLFKSLMKVLLWNCRGAANLHFRRHFHNLMNEHQPYLVVITETKIGRDRGKDICESLGFSKFEISEPVGFVDGIWLLWNDLEVYCDILLVTQQEIHAFVQDLHRNGLEIDESCSLQHRLHEAGTEKNIDQQAVASSDLDSVMPNTVSYDDSKLELLNNVPNSSMVAISGNKVPLSSNQNDQDSKSKSPQQINVIQNMEVPELRTPLEQEAELQGDQFDVGSPHSSKESLELFFHVAQIQSPNQRNSGSKRIHGSFLCKSARRFSIPT